jgi:hypothetical protein
MTAIPPLPNALVPAGAIAPTTPGVMAPTTILFSRFSSCANTFGVSAAANNAKKNTFIVFLIREPPLVCKKMWGKAVVNKERGTKREPI